MISYCGLDCHTCLIYLAAREINKTNKEKMISEIVDKCKEHYGVELEYEDILDCDGCKSVIGRIFTSCSNCKIRKCAIEKEIENCAHCSEYACENLMALFKTDPCAQTRLDIIRSIS
jgi:hypothetical protein